MVIRISIQNMILSEKSVQIATAILAGGKSSRMGNPKAGTRLSTGETMFERVYSVVRQTAGPCCVLGHADGIEISGHPDLHIIPDKVPERGPVGALLSLFSSGIASYYIVAACDQPLLTTQLLNRLQAEIDETPCVFCDQDETNIAPLPGLYPATLLPHVEQLLLQPRASLRELLARSNFRTIALDPESWTRLRSCNTPGDVEEVNRILQDSSR